MECFIFMPLTCVCDICLNSIIIIFKQPDPNPCTITDFQLNIILTFDKNTGPKAGSTVMI